MANSKSPPGSTAASRLIPLGITALAIAILALAAPHLGSLSAHLLHPVPIPIPIPAFFRSNNNESTPSTDQQQKVEQSKSTLTEFICDPQHPYTTEIISLDPLLIYIRDFLSPTDTAALLAAAAAAAAAAAGESAFKPSEVYKGGRKQGTADRTSSSAGLPRDDPAVACVLDRAARFMGLMLDAGRDDVGPPQLVRYAAGQRFNSHNDWYAAPRGSRPEDRWRGASWNRVASFFAVLEDACEGGETWFPRVDVGARDDGMGSREKKKKNEEEEEEEEEGGDDVKRGRNSSSEKEKVWRRHEDGGVAFAPVSGNALFWVNLFPNGTGDPKTLHAGLPVQSGMKTAMNIWPRKYYD